MSIFSDSPAIRLLTGLFLGVCTGTMIVSFLLDKCKVSCCHSLSNPYWWRYLKLVLFIYQRKDAHYEQWHHSQPDAVYWCNLMVKEDVTAISFFSAFLVYHIANEAQAFLFSSDWISGCDDDDHSWTFLRTQLIHRMNEKLNKQSSKHFKPIEDNQRKVPLRV